MHVGVYFYWNDPVKPKINPSNFGHRLTKFTL